MKPLYKKYETDKANALLKFNLVALLAETVAELSASELDRLCIRLVRPQISGALLLSEQNFAGNYIVTDGDEVSVNLVLPSGKNRVTVEAEFGTNTRTLAIVDIFTTSDATGTFEPEAITTPVVKQLTDVSREEFEELKRVAANAKSVTYAELKEARDNGELVAGQAYRITDYVATVANDAEARSAGHAFDVIVVATDADKLGEQAMAALHEGDEYFAGCKLEAWRLMYCIDNDTDRFAWADEENGKGVIWRMVDEWGNDAPFDFKGIQVRRYSCAVPEEKTFYGNYEDKEDDVTVTTAIEIAVTTGDSRYLNSNDIVEGVSVPDEAMAKIHRYLYERFDYSDNWLAGSAMSLWKNGSYAAMRVAPAYQFTASGRTYYVTAVLKKTENARWFYLFSTAEDKEDENQDWTAMAQEDILDASCDGANYSVFENVIEAQRESGVVQLQHNLFFGNDCYSNTFGNECYSNTFGNECYSNTFGNDCYSNTFGNSCSSNTFGNECYSNTFGNECYSNTFGNSCYSNTFGNSCSYNTFGNSCSYNTFGNSCSYNTFGNECSYNTFGNSCYSNTFGNSCYSNTFGNSCYSNTFGEGAGNNAVTKDYMRYVMLENGVKYVNVSCDDTTSSSTYGQNILVHAGVEGTSQTRKTCEITDAGNAFLTEFGTVQQGTIS